MIEPSAENISGRKAEDRAKQQEKLPEDLVELDKLLGNTINRLADIEGFYPEKQKMNSETQREIGKNLIIKTKLLKKIKEELDKEINILNPRLIKLKEILNSKSQDMRGVDNLYLPEELQEAA